MQCEITWNSGDYEDSDDVPGGEEGLETWITVVNGFKKLKKLIFKNSSTLSIN